ncbi:uncharacterized protein MELLADRAFT_111777 [Melampsora larici-populina 98AG31]|uniref:Uncharacterized protein n=1 Tax=Melampsora larici-populina (strain 98AG31 / pathotype 3-4-7) TaxID=747676 RepID=F4S470_MELLP|nr:uncharacterized protein MELLADRAFT_111777 [Melampsora larici-populina 98AG31]EGG00558.1 hypothetical protein MELLADRAFT_111777 [Melampsora larici-populina 98AG31]
MNSNSNHTDVDDLKNIVAETSIRWETDRQNWLRSKPSFTSSGSDQIRGPSSSNSVIIERDQQVAEKFNVAFERIVNSYDVQAKLNHSNDIPKQILLRTADQLKDPDRRFITPLPLKHAVAVLYRSWFHDGTIPEGYPFGPCQSSSSEEDIQDDNEDKDPKWTSTSEPLSTPLTSQVQVQPTSTSKTSETEPQYMNTLNSSLSFSSSFFNVPKPIPSMNDVKLTKIYLTRV